MKFEGLICPICSNPLDEEKLSEKLECPKCGKNLKQKKYLAFLEFLMMHGIVTNIDFFDPKLYGDEIKKGQQEKELKDETDPDEFEDKAEKIERYDENVDLQEKTTDEEEFRDWDGVEEDWIEFNKKNDEKNKK